MDGESVQGAEGEDDGGQTNKQTNKETQDTKEKQEKTITLYPTALKFQSAIDVLRLNHLQISCGLDICISQDLSN